MSTQVDVDRREDVLVTKQPGVEKREVVTDDVNTRKRQTLERVSAMIAFVFIALEGLIGLRVLLKLLDANAKNGFGGAVYNVTGLFVAPFTGLFGNPALGGNILEITSVIAMIVYALLIAGSQYGGSDVRASVQHQR